MEISGVKSVSFSRQDASDFLSAYKGVIPEHPAWVAQLSSGVSIAIQVRGTDIVQRMRELAGPYDPEIARHLQPTSLRAAFGTTSVTNCVHVTDLTHDGPLECQFVFEVL
jgi:nucleoside-diphosphate kinase